MGLGKILGAFFGFMLAGPIGLLIGLYFGHKVDEGIRSNAYTINSEPEQIKQTQSAFFKVTFQTMGHVAKADGVVTHDEIQAARNIMYRMQLSPSQKKLAIEYFNEGKQPNFNLDKSLRQLIQDCHYQRSLLQTFVEIQFQAAQADGFIGQNKKAILQTICSRLGFEPLFSWDYEDIFGPRKRQRVHQSTQHKGDLLEEAYRIFEVSPKASDNDVKKAYRRLMNQHHPDKLIAKGLPEEMIKLATDKTQKIKQAYERIKQERGL